MRLSLLKSIGAALLGLSLFASCTKPETLKPQIRPSGLVKPEPPKRVATKPEGPSAKSNALASYFTKVEQQLLAQGLLRRDGGGPDTRFDADDLSRNFAAIAFYNEHSGDTLSSGAAESRFHPWRGPVRVSTIFGSSVPQEQRAQDKANTAQYLARLSRITGRSIAPAVSSRANFHVLFMGADDSTELASTVRRLWPSFPAARITAMQDLPQDIYCLVHTNLPSAAPGEERAIAVIRAEHPDLMRLSCIHEEIAQGLGLSNDSPTARPSIFNDDEEFATLTTHDEYLLKMLYDKRLTSGMTLPEARPLLYQIAAELTGETGS